VAFTVAVIAAFVALARETPVVWVSYLPLAPLALLWFTGAAVRTIARDEPNVTGGPGVEGVGTNAPVGGYSALTRRRIESPSSFTT
jgi:hypothetical protein